MFTQILQDWGGIDRPPDLDCHRCISN